MRAIVMTRHGSPDGLQLKEVEKPTPRDNEVLIKVYAATVIAGDTVLRRLHPLFFLLLQRFGIRKKRIPGHELAGEIEAVGRAVTRFKPGDQVFGTTSGLSVGANAEYVCLPETAYKGVLAIKPAGWTYEQAAALPVGGMTAMYLLKTAQIERGQRVLIYGASGSVGTYAIQLARQMGAAVTGVCSTANIELVKSLGADTVIDYTTGDFARNGQTYDVIFDAVGKLPAAIRGSALKAGGRYLSVRATTHETIENLMALKALAEAGKIRAVIDRCYPLEQTAEAHRYVETGRKKGNVVITVAQDDRP